MLFKSIISLKGLNLFYCPEALQNTEKILLISSYFKKRGMRKRREKT